MAYNISFMDNTPSIVELYAGINTESGMMLSIILLLSLWVVIFISMKHFDTKVVFLSASTTTTIVSILMLGLGWINMTIVFFPLIMTMFSLIAFYFSKD